MPRIIGHNEVPPTEWSMSIERVGGSSDGEVFRTVDAVMDDGSVERLWVSDQREGYFKTVFVPWDFRSRKIVV